MDNAGGWAIKLVFIRVDKAINIKRRLKKMCWRIRGQQQRGAEI